MKNLVVLIAVVLMAALSSDYAFSGEPIPKIKQDCKICHVSHTTGGDIVLIAPPSELCLGCHPETKALNNHRVDIVPMMPVSNLPLDKQGRMTCITCHDPHGKAGFRRMLRASPDKICAYCHKM